MGRACTRHGRARTRLIAYRDINPEERFGVRLRVPPEPWLWIVRSSQPRPALQKYKIKGLDQLFVTVTDLFHRENCREKNSNSNFS